MPAITFRSYAMVYSMEHFRRCGSPSQQHHPHLPSSNACSVIEAPPLTSSAAAATTKKARRVRFQEAANEYHSNAVMHQEECRGLWYNRNDYKRFRHNLASDFDKVSTKRVLFLWAKKLAQSYEAYGFVTTAQEVRNIRKRDSEQYYPLELIGLEQAILCAFQKSVDVQRERLYREVQYWQNDSSARVERLARGPMRDEAFRAASCGVSQQSKLWAQHTARLVLQGEVV